MLAYYLFRDIRIITKLNSFCYNTAVTVKNIIFETDNFTVDTPEKPFIDRLEGGHIRISPKFKISDRTQLTPEQAREYIKLSMVVGEAMKIGMGKQGIDIGIVNYQDMGNWAVFKPEGPTMHMHVFGRAKTATIQKYGEAVLLPKKETGFYDEFKRLTDEDITEISKEIERLLATNKYKNF
jgi:diadenosine tetraphosphate (Ap4A) HIT family hydrolase